MSVSRLLQATKNSKLRLFYLLLVVLITGLSVAMRAREGSRQETGEFKEHLQEGLDFAETWPSLTEEIPSHVIGPGGARSIDEFFDRAKMPVYRVDDKEQLGSRQEVEVFETEHHLYRVPFHYENVSVDYWYEYSDKGIEIAADAGSITIVEEKAIVSVILVGTGCSSPGYNVVEWWTQDEDISTTHGQLIKRQRIDNLKGQHNAWIQRALTHKPDFKSVEEANKFMDRMQRNIYAMTQGYYVPGSIMSGCMKTQPISGLET